MLIIREPLSDCESAFGSSDDEELSCVETTGGSLDCGELSGVEMTGGSADCAELSDGTAADSDDTGAAEVLSGGALTVDEVADELIADEIDADDDVETGALSCPDDSTSDELPALSENPETLSSTKASPTDGIKFFPTKTTTAMPINIKTAVINPLRKPLSFIPRHPKKCHFMYYNILSPKKQI